MKPNIVPAPAGAGICPNCDRLVPAGTDAYRDGDGWRHAQCSGEAERRARIEERRAQRKNRIEERRAQRKNKPNAKKARVLVVRPDGKRVIEARIGGRCPSCSWPIARGDLIVYDTALSSWVHDRCV